MYSPTGLRCASYGLLLAAFSVAACSSAGRVVNYGDAPDLQDGVNELTPVPNFVAATVAPSPNAPLNTQGGAIAWPSAKLLSGVTVSVGRDSATIQVPVSGISGAADVRVFALNDALEISGSATEHVKGADIYCAGLQQTNDAVGPAVIMQPVDVYGLTGTTRLVVEVVSALCPFTGARASVHYDGQAGNPELKPNEVVPFSFYTEAEVRKTYDSLVINGHGPGNQLAAPAPAVDLTVLARTTIDVTPKGYGVIPLDYWDDFDDPHETPTYQGALPVFSDRNSVAQMYQSKRWTYYSSNYDNIDLKIDRGQLQTVVSDLYQDVFATNYFTPRRPVTISNADYLHVRFAAPSDSTQRRYWWIFLCGSDRAGETMDEHGKLKQAIAQMSFFYQSDGLNPSLANWNCLQVFPRDGSPFKLPPTDTRSQSDVLVMVNKANGGYRSNVTNVSPDQYNVSGTGNSWYRQQDGSGNVLAASILDDQLTIGLRTGIDLFVSRTRVVMFVNGQQRLCNDFKNHPLTMAEGALGFGQVLYHTAAEHHEFAESFNLRNGQRYYLANTPYLDVRSWDYAGYQEHTSLPASFSGANCYAYQ